MLDHVSRSVPLAEAAALCPWPKATAFGLKAPGPCPACPGLASAALFVFCCAWVLWQPGALAAVSARFSNQSLVGLCVKLLCSVLAC